MFIEISKMRVIGKERNKGNTSWNIMETIRKKGAIRHLPYTIPQLAQRLQETLPRGYTWKDYLAGNTDLHLTIYDQLAHGL